MKPKKVYIAVDLGAGSGRVLAGIFDGEKIKLEECARFENKPLELDDGSHWDLEHLQKCIYEGLTKGATLHGDTIVSIGIDTWGVDYGLLDAQGTLLEPPYQYRDSRTKGMLELACERLSKKSIYEATGIQFMFFNTLFQLLAAVHVEKSTIAKATDLLFVPDLLGYWLTGEKSQERSIASTSQLYNPKIHDWDFDLIDKMGLPRRLFKKISDPGTELGLVKEALADSMHLSGVKVISVAGHDTACAVAGLPTQSKTPAFLSSGTWSLMGIELSEPVINEQSYTDTFTNEIGINRSIRFLKNICGLWLIQESCRSWSEDGDEVAYADMAGLAQSEPAFRSLINPDDARFAEAGEMPEKIRAFCRDTNQAIPETKGAIIRCIYESLALRYASVWDKLVQYTPEAPDTLHVVGGGCQDALLNQFTANALGIPVSAGPVEATGLGNVITQMLADGVIRSVAEGRQIIADSFPVVTYEPKETAKWQSAKETFQRLCASKQMLT